MFSQNRDFSEIMVSIVQEIVLDDVILYGEYLLLFAVLNQAIKDLTHEKPHIRQEARLYFKSSTGLFSFPQICDYLGINEFYLKEKLLNKNLL